MKGKRDTGIPEFQSLEEEREYWETRGPLAEGHEGKINKPRPRQKRSSFLAVRLTGEELRCLRDLAAKQGLGPSTFARLVLTSVVEHGSQLPKRITLDQIRDALEENLPQPVKEKAEDIARAISIGDPPFLLEMNKIPVEELEEFAIEVTSSLLAMAGVELVTSKSTEQKEQTPYIIEYIN